MAAGATLPAVAAAIRAQVIRLSHQAGTPHLGSCLSCVDLLVALYWTSLTHFPQHPDHPQRDRFILSKGHAATALYSVLASRGFFSPEALFATYAADNSRYPEHPAPRSAPGVEWATGSLGHGLPVATGFALAAQLRSAPNRTFVLLSDGECNEGTVWEAAMFAAAQRLGSLTVLVDYNKWQATGRSDTVMALHPLAEKWRSFGWEALEIDGHDFTSISAGLQHAATPERTQPLALIAHTIKGRGVSFMEDDNNWHYRIPDADEVERAIRELGVS